jgi:D-alanyl-D-alanine carboxypeptidase
VPVLRLLLFGLVGLSGLIVAGPSMSPMPPSDRAPAPAVTAGAQPGGPRDRAPALAAESVQAVLRLPSFNCSKPGFERAAQINSSSLTTLVWKPFHRDEVGWEVYAPRIAAAIGAICPPTSTGFAAALARWQSASRLPANGQMDATTFGVMSDAWERARPFVRVSQAGICPSAPSPADLVWADPEEGYMGKPIQLRPGALAAYRRLIVAARMSSPAIAADHRLLSIVSGYRSPESDAARCVEDGNCGNVSRALCSAHRTGLAMDLYLGASSGDDPVSSDDANRLYLSKTPVYAWMIANAAAYGFVNYPFEPWHWEWTGGAQ